ncbi:MAG: ABC transporter ATP-binding protein, partial [Cyanobacteria bacterium REEB65]|nr:ABC transporter ATP-binding protein [Cyanobacteria bacterium REEB65]
MATTQARGTPHQQEETPERFYDPRVLGRLLGYARPQLPHLSLCVFLLFAIGALQLSQPYWIKLAIDRQLAPGTHGSLAGLWSLARIYLAVLVLGSALSYVQGLLLQAAGQQIIGRIRKDIFDHLLTLGLEFFDHNPVGRLVTRVTNDTDALNEMYTSIGVNLFRDVFFIGGTIAIMLHLNWKLAMVGFAVMPAVAGTTALAQRILRRIWRVVRAQLAQINATLAENFSGMRIIQACNRQRSQLLEFQAINDAYFEASWRQLHVTATMRPLLDLLSQIALAGTLWFGGQQALHGTLELGTLYAFTSYLRQLYNPISELAEKFNTLQGAMASAERIFQLLDTRPAIVDGTRAVALTAGRGAVEF